MRRNMIVAVTMLFVLGKTTLAQVDRPLRSIFVSGTVVTKTAPDHIVWRISLTDTDKDMRQAKERNDEKIKSVVALRRKLDVDEGDLETGRVSIRREYERDGRGRQGEFKHFVVRSSVTIRQRDLTRFDDFLDTLVATAEMEVNFSFESSRIHEIRSDTRLKALQVARDKAAAMAKVVGATLGRVITINEHSERGRQQPFYNGTLVFSGTPTVDVSSEKFVPGAISVQVSVYAAFELE